MIDLALAPERGVHGHHRKAIGFHVAVATSLANALIYEQTSVGIVHHPTLTPPAFLGCTCLVIDEHAHAAVLAALTLHRIKRVPVCDDRARRKLSFRGVFLRLIGDHDDLAHAFGIHLTRNHLGRDNAIYWLAARHRDGVVEQNLVGDVHVRGHARANSEKAGMEVSAVP